jgi:hypothetical protein
MEERPRYGLYQFAPTGFPASRDLYALSQGVAYEEENPIVDSKVADRRKRGDCSPFDLDRIEDWRTVVTGERPRTYSAFANFGLIFIIRGDMFKFAALKTV